MTRVAKVISHEYLDITDAEFTFLARVRRVLSSGIVKPPRIWKISLAVHSFCLILLQGFFQPFGMLSGRERLFTREYSRRRTRLRTLTIDRSQPEPSRPPPAAAPSNIVSLTGRFIGLECESYRPRENSSSRETGRVLRKFALARSLELPARRERIFHSRVRACALVPPSTSV